MTEQPEPPPVRQQIRAAAFNAVEPALRRHDEWVRLTVRRTVADAVLTAIEDYLNIGDSEAWCKACRRVWNGKAHQCEGDAEQRLARLRDSASRLHAHGAPSMATQFVLDIIDGHDDTATQATGDPT